MQTEIYVVGMATLYAGAKDLDEFWETILEHHRKIYAESDPARAVELMSVLVAIEREVGRSNAEADAEWVAEIEAHIQAGGRRSILASSYVETCDSFAPIGPGWARVLQTTGIVLCSAGAGRHCAVTLQPKAR